MFSSEGAPLVQADEAFTVLVWVHIPIGDTDRRERVLLKFISQNNPTMQKTDPHIYLALAQ